MPMQASQQEQTGSAGVARVMADFADINWGPVENVRHDLGVDIFLQVRDERRFDRAVMVMAQVKSGESYFRDEELSKAGEVCGWWYSESTAKHFEDWVQHGLPHLLVMHDPRTKTSHWVHVTREGVLSTGKGYKVLVPKHQVVDDDSLDALLEVAATAKLTPALQGTSYTAGANAISPGRVLRHALLAPRLVAPHPSRQIDGMLAPEEAIALLTIGKTQRFEHAELTEKEIVPTDASVSKDWRWRFFAAYGDWVQRGSSDALVALAQATAQAPAGKREEPYRLAAIVSAAAAALCDAELWSDALALLDIAPDDLPPVDSAWVEMHKAVILSENGDITRARKMAAQAQRRLLLDSDDVTASALAASAAELIFHTTAWSARDVGMALTAVDTATAWWRSQEVSWAVEDHDRRTFESWAHEGDVGADLSADGDSRLRGAWLTAALSGDRDAASVVMSLRSHQQLIAGENAWRAAEYDKGSDSVAAVTNPLSVRPEQGAALQMLASSLDALRRYGDGGGLDLACQRLWAGGPVTAVRQALEASISSPWVHSTGKTKLALLERAGDLLDEPDADNQALYLLSVLRDPTSFAEAVRPSFLVSHYATRAVRGILPAMSDDGQRETLRYVVDAITRATDATINTELVRFLSQFRIAAVTGFEDLVATLWDHEVKSVRAGALRLSIGLGDESAGLQLNSLADAGDREAVAQIGSVDKLTLTAAATLIGQEVASVQTLIEEAEGGSWSFGGWDSLRALTVVNLAFADLANWDPVISALANPAVASSHKIDTLSILAFRIDDVPPEVRNRMREILSRSPLKGVEGLGPGEEDFQQAVFALGTAVGAITPTAAMRRIVTWLKGSRVQRQSAGSLLTALGRAAEDLVVQGTLVLLTSDGQSSVRARAAVALAGVASAASHPAVQEALLAAAQDPGCRVPLSLATALARRAMPDALSQSLEAELSANQSARVRQAMAGQSG